MLCKPSTSDQAFRRLTQDLPTPFVEFGEQSWELLFQLPYFLSRPEHALKDEIITALKGYFDTTSDQRHGQA